MMPFTDLKTQYAALREAIGARMQRVLDHGQYIMGPEVAELEAALAGFVGARHAITVASGTEALVIALMALEIRPGDEVITTPFTFAASAEAIVLAGGVPVFVDIEADTCNIDANLIEASITSRTRAIMPVGLYGQPCEMEAINAIAGRHGLAVIEDAAQSFGATYRGRRSCALSTLGATSFFPSKPLGCYGDGGALFTDDDALAQAARSIRVHGQRARYEHERIGVGGRMDTLQCAVVLAKLERFGWELERREWLAQRYRRGLGNVEGLDLVGQRPHRRSAWAQFTVLVDRRDDVAAALKAAGVPTAIHYPRPLHHQRAYATYAPGEACPNAASTAARVLCLPMSADLHEADQDRIVCELGQACSRLAN